MRSNCLSHRAGPVLFLFHFSLISFHFWPGCPVGSTLALFLPLECVLCQQSLLYSLGVLEIIPSSKEGGTTRPQTDCTRATRVQPRGGLSPPEAAGPEHRLGDTVYSIVRRTWAQQVPSSVTLARPLPVSEVVREADLCTARFTIVAGKEQCGS